MVDGCVALEHYAEVGYGVLHCMHADDPLLQPCGEAYTLPGPGAAAVPHCITVCHGHAASTGGGRHIIAVLTLHA